MAHAPAPTAFRLCWCRSVSQHVLRGSSHGPHMVGGLHCRLLPGRCLGHWWRKSRRKVPDLGDLLPEALEWVFKCSTEDQKEESKKKHFPGTSIPDWTLSFAIFMFVMVHFSPHRSVPLATYMVIVARLARVVPAPFTRHRQFTLPSLGTAGSRTCSSQLWWSSMSAAPWQSACVANTKAKLGAALATFTCRRLCLGDKQLCP